MRTDNLAATGTVSTTDFYYSGPGGQVLEERPRLPSSPIDGSTAVTQQYVYSPRYVDASILRTQTTATYSTSGSTWSSTTVTYYYLTDTNNNVTAVTDSSGNVVERYVYSAFGNVQVYTPDYATLLSASAVGNRLFFGGTPRDEQNGAGPDGPALVQPAERAPSSPPTRPRVTRTSIATPATIRPTTPIPMGWQIRAAAARRRQVGPPAPTITFPWSEQGGGPSSASGSNQPYFYSSSGTHDSGSAPGPSPDLQKAWRQSSISRRLNG